LSFRICTRFFDPESGISNPELKAVGAGTTFLQLFFGEPRESTVLSVALLFVVSGNGFLLNFLSSQNRSKNPSRRTEFRISGQPTTDN
jgi:hypothetical protein